MDLQELSDRQQIVDLITRYTRAVDTGSYDVADVFTDDAVLDYSSAGGPVAAPAEALGWVAEMLGIMDRTQHLIGQVAVDLGGDEARATAYFTNPMVLRHADGSEQLIEVGGYYHHRLRRTEAGWRSVHLVDELVWQRGV